MNALPPTWLHCPDVGGCWERVLSCPWWSPTSSGNANSFYCPKYRAFSAERGFWIPKKWLWIIPVTGVGRGGKDLRTHPIVQTEKRAQEGPGCAQSTQQTIVEPTLNRVPASRSRAFPTGESQFLPSTNMPCAPPHPLTGWGAGPQGLKH